MPQKKRIKERWFESPFCRAFFKPSISYLSLVSSPTLLGFTRVIHNPAKTWDISGQYASFSNCTLALEVSTGFKISVHLQ